MLPRRAAADGLPERRRAEASDAGRGRRLPRHHAGARSRDDLRRRRRRGRAGRARDGRLRRLRGPLGAGPRSARHRRTGGRLGADRELSRLSDRHLRPGPGRARLHPGAEVRRRDRDPAGGARGSIAAARAATGDAAAARADRRTRPCAPRPSSSPPARATAARTSRTSTTFEGAGVSYWASPVEAKLCEGEEVALVGGGNSAGQAVVYLAPQGQAPASHRARAGLEETMSRYLVDRIAALPNVNAACRTRDRRARRRPDAGPVRGDPSATRAAGRRIAADAPSLPVHRRRSQRRLDRACRVARTATASSSPAPLCAGTGPERRPALPLETSQPGVFAIGDVRAGSTKRVAAAVGEGAAVVAQIHAVLALAPERIG